MAGSTAAAGRAVQRLSNLLWERRLDISTRGVVPVDHPDSVHYAAMNYASVNRVLDHLELAPSDVFVDIGSGKGRVLCCAARHRVARVVGVDLSAEFCEQARRNALRTRGRRSPIEVNNAFADEFDYSECTVYFLFSPFGEDTLRRVLAKIHKDRDGRPVRFAYANPGYPAAFADQAWLERYDFWDATSRGEEHSVAYYRSI
jgi:cyclopropane fatty-acyl-phospholipid synthase-like methyltransferase